MVPEELEKPSSYLDRYVYNTTFHLPKKAKSFSLLKLND